MKTLAFLFACACALLPAIAQESAGLERIIVSPDQRGFVTEKTGKPFTPWGVNYGNEGRLMEDFWEKEWETFAGDFREIKEMGGNVVRVHLQFGKFMDGPDQPNAKSFEMLGKMLELAETTGIYVDITGLAGYRPADRPKWYDEMDEAKRWDAQAAFWRAVAEKCASSPAVFCYDLMNEPVSPAQKRDKWYSGHLLGEYDFIQQIGLDVGDRTRGEIAIAWIKKLTAAIREKDQKHLVTVGLLPWVEKWKHLSGFVPKEIAPHVDFISVHIYPDSKKPNEAPTALHECKVGKPVVIEETFPLHCKVAELEKFLRDSREIASGWVFHYDGITIAEYDALENEGKLTIPQSIWREGLRTFVRLRPDFVASPK